MGREAGQSQVYAINYSDTHPLEVQRYVLQLAEEGCSEQYIRERTGLHTNALRVITRQRIVVPKPAKEYKCECGARVVTKPCFSCELKRYLNED